MTAADLVREFEGCSLVPYQDEGGVWTIGWGHATPEKHPPITQEQADAYLADDLATAEAIVDAHVVVTLTANERAALTSFVFNVGPGRKGVKDGFVTLKSGAPSTMLKRLNECDLPAAAEEFPKWCRIGPNKSRGLLRRRLAEQLLFNQ